MNTDILIVFLVIGSVLAGFIGGVLYLYYQVIFGDATILVRRVRYAIIGLQLVATGLLFFPWSSVQGQTFSGVQLFLLGHSWLTGALLLSNAVAVVLVISKKAVHNYFASFLVLASLILFFTAQSHFNGQNASGAPVFEFFILMVSVSLSAFLSIGVRIPSESRLGKFSTIISGAGGYIKNLKTIASEMKATYSEAAANGYRQRVSGEFKRHSFAIFDYYQRVAISAVTVFRIEVALDLGEHDFFVLYNDPLLRARFSQVHGVNRFGLIEDEWVSTNVNNQSKKMVSLIENSGLDQQLTDNAWIGYQDGKLFFEQYSMFRRKHSASQMKAILEFLVASSEKLPKEKSSDVATPTAKETLESMQIISKKAQENMLKRQVQLYDKLPFQETFRGKSALWLLVSVIVNGVITAINGSLFTLPVLFELMIMVGIVIGSAMGKRLAFLLGIAFMIMDRFLWITFLLLSSRGSFLVIWVLVAFGWTMFMLSNFVNAYKVEQRRSVHPFSKNVVLPLLILGTLGITIIAVILSFA